MQTTKDSADKSPAVREKPNPGPDNRVIKGGPGSRTDKRPPVKK